MITPRQTTEITTSPDHYHYLLVIAETIGSGHNCSAPFIPTFDGVNLILVFLELQQHDTRLLKYPNSRAWASCDILLFNFLAFPTNPKVQKIA